MHVHKNTATQYNSWRRDATLMRARVVLTGCRESQKGPREV